MVNENVGGSTKRDDSRGADYRSQSTAENSDYPLRDIEVVQNGHQ